MAAILLIPVYLLINYYVLRWILRWMGACYKYFESKYFRLGFVVFFFIFSTTPLTSFLITAEPLHRILKILSNIWFGIFLYSILCIAAADLVRLVVKHTQLLRQEIYRSRTTLILSGTVTLSAIIALSTYGILHARYLHTASYDISIEKDGGQLDSLRVVLAADLHLGYNIGEWHVQNMVNKINRLDADLVVFAGDIFDNDYDSVKKPDEIQQILSRIESRYGVYACYGNHDLDEPILAGFTFSTDSDKNDDSRMEAFFKNADIQLLNDKAILIENSFYLVGRKDFSRAPKVEQGRLSPTDILNPLDLSKPVLVADHQPKEYKELADAGADLDLSGHTHNGQLFPGNLLISLLWENPYGYEKKGNMHTIVTSGVGIWGPNMRIGTKSELVLVNVHFGNLEP